MKRMATDGQWFRVCEDRSIFLKQRQIIGNERIIWMRIECLKHRGRFACIGASGDDERPTVGHQARAMHERVSAPNKRPSEHRFNGICVKHMGRGAQERRREDARLRTEFNANGESAISQASLYVTVRVADGPIGSSRHRNWTWISGVR